MPGHRSDCRKLSGSQLKLSSQLNFGHHTGDIMAGRAKFDRVQHTGLRSRAGMQTGPSTTLRIGTAVVNADEHSSPQSGRCRIVSNSTEPKRRCSPGRQGWRCSRCGAIDADFVVRAGRSDRPLSQSRCCGGACSGDISSGGTSSSVVSVGGNTGSVVSNLLRLRATEVAAFFRAATLRPAVLRVAVFRPRVLRAAAAF